MNNTLSDSDETLRSVEEDPGFQQAVANCIQQLEDGRQIDAAWLKQCYPQWHENLAVFIADWDAVDGYSNEVRNVQDCFVFVNDTIPDSIGEYQILEQVGIGGMGVIYKARHQRLSRTVAIKMLHNLRHDRRRFEMEAEAASRLEHPNIVSIYEVHEHQGHPFFTMQFIDGCDLETLIGHEKLPPRDAASIAATISDAVHYAHQRGILHRDLKPGNILIDKAGEPHITDFGLAKQIENTDHLTRTHAIIGTPSYMAPEQALGKNADVSVATDVYGVGAILYAMLTGEAPFRGNSSMDVLRKVVDSNPRKLDSSVVTEDLRVICKKCLEKKPGDRYQSAGELSADLKRFLAGEPIMARPLGRLPTAIRWAKRNPTIATFGFLASVMLLFALVSISLLLRTEHKARKAAEVNNTRERKLNTQIQNTLVRENAARRQAELTLNDAYASYGYAAQRQNRPNEAFLWFCKAACDLPENESPEIDERIETNRNRIASWMARIPRPIFACHEKGMKLASFDSSNEWLLCYREDQQDFRVFNLRTGRPVHLDFENSPNCVIWSNQSGTLWFGDSIGNVMRLDCDSGDLKIIAQVPDAVSCLAESTDGSKLAIGFEDRATVYDLQNQSLSKNDGEMPAAIFAIQFCCNNRSLLATCEDNHVYKKNVARLCNGTIDDEEMKFPFVLRKRGGLVGPENRQQFSPIVFDDNQLAVLQVSDDESLQLVTYDLSDGQLMNTCNLEGCYSNSTPNHLGEIVTGGDQYARVRTIQGGLHSERIVHDHRVTRCATSFDGQIVATAGWQNVLLTERTEIREMFRHDTDVKPSFAILPHQTRVSQLSFSNNSRLLATVQFDGLIRVWDIASARQPKVDIPVEPGGNMATFAEGPFRCLLTGIHHRTGEVHSVREVDRETGKTRPIVSNISGNLRGVATSKDGQHFALAIAAETGDRHRLRIFNCVSTDSNTSIVEESTEPVRLPADPRAIAAHPTLNRFAVLCGSGETVIVNGDSGQIEGGYRVSNVSTTIPSYPRHNGVIAWSSDGNSILQVGNTMSSGIRIFDAKNYRERFPVFKNEGYRIQQFDILKDGNVVAIAGGRSNKVYFLNTETGEQIANPIEHPAVVYSARFSPDGQTLVSSCRDGQARVFDWRTGKILTNALEHEGDVVDACFANHGSNVITISHDKLARIWDVDTGLQACPPIFVGDGMRYLETDSQLNRALVSGRVPKVVLLQLDRPNPPTSTSLQELYLLAELVSHASIVNAGAVRLTTDEWMMRWKRYLNTECFKADSANVFATAR